MEILWLSKYFAHKKCKLMNYAYAFLSAPCFVNVARYARKYETILRYVLNIVISPQEEEHLSKKGVSGISGSTTLLEATSCTTRTRAFSVV